MHLWHGMNNFWLTLKGGWARWKQLFFTHDGITYRESSHQKSDRQDRGMVGGGPRWKVYGPGTSQVDKFTDSSNRSSVLTCFFFGWLLFSSCGALCQTGLEGGEGVGPCELWEQINYSNNFCDSFRQFSCDNRGNWTGSTCVRCQRWFMLELLMRIYKQITHIRFTEFHISSHFPFMKVQRKKKFLSAEIALLCCDRKMGQQRWKILHQKLIPPPAGGRWLGIHYSPH